jgi:hypothetical protein
MGNICVARSDMWDESDVKRGSTVNEGHLRNIFRRGPNLQRDAAWKSEEKVSATG